VEVIWHDVECGAYGADLPLWRQLAGEAAGPVLELGSGTGRVALDLASAGFEVTAVDREPALIDALRRRAAERGLDVAAELAAVRHLDLDRRFALIVAPMQLVQLLRGAGGRAAMLARSRAHLAPGGRIAVALLGPQAARSAGAGRELEALAPDVLEIDGWVYSSLPIEVHTRDDSIEVRRLRQVVAPGGELTDSVDVTLLDALTVEDLEREGLAAGLRPGGRIAIAPTADHVGSTVTLLEEAP
jgi:SAM-dependent methyltransferase